MKTRVLGLIFLAAVVSLVASCCGVPDYEFLAIPRAGLKAGSLWKEKIGPISDGPPAGVQVAEKVQGADWLQSKTEGKGSANAAWVLQGFFSVNLGISREEITDIEAEGLVHQQVVDPEKMPRGYAYLWETIEASKIRLKVAKKLEGVIEGKIDKFSNSELGKKANLQFKLSGSDSSTYEVTGKNLVVAVRVVRFDIATDYEVVTLKLAKDFQNTAQTGAFGYSVSVESVDLPNRRIDVLLRNQQIADSATGTWKLTLTSAGTSDIHAGPVVGETYDRAVDRAYVSSWDLTNLTCQVVFERTTWELKQVGCGLETVR